MQSLLVTQRLRRGESRGIIDPRRAFQRFALSCYEAPSHLKLFIDHFWIVRWDTSLGAPPRCDYLLTQPAFTASLSRSAPYVRGITTNKVVVTMSGNGVEVGMKFTPGGLYAFWPHDMSKFTDQHIPIDTVFPEVDASFLQKLYAIDDDRHFLATMEQLLEARLPKASRQLSLIQDIIRMVNGGDSVPTSKIAASFALSERTLQHLFATQVGVGVKWPIMRNRLLQGVHEAHTTTKPNWARIAADLGYSTQSHFINDFRRHLGISPSAFQNGLDKRGKIPAL